ncbi:hypothetical protein KL86PLE_40356 [uncultured Pleomorphomonas sp.]|uniref:Uncharacterized protein n=1 Tax=uncultured Pleomorphomonas sp. TaxID=442121 RepID=A0A212LGE0_9HYPH|nr:hypothetical protein KL86PLE_40356 [uncultured Pleomorphomonas sp.]
MTTRPDRSSAHAASKASAMAADPLPAPTTTSRPSGGGGRCAGISRAGWAAATAASNIERRRTRGVIVMSTVFPGASLPPTRAVGSEGALDQIGRPSGDVVLDVVDELVGERLLRLVRRPSNMRRHDDVGALGDAHQRAVGRWRLEGGDVEAGAADQSFIERLLQGRLVDQAAAGGVEDERLALHLPELGEADHVGGVGRQRTVDSDDIGRLQHLVPRGIERTEAGLALMGGEHGLHAEDAGDLGDPLPEKALTDDAETSATEIVDRMVEEAELAGFLPFTLKYVGAERDDGAAEGEHQGEGVLGNRHAGIAADVADGDAMALAVGLIDAVGAGGRDGNQLEVGQLPQDISGQPNLVDDGDRSICETVYDLIGVSMLVFGILMWKGRPPHPDLGRDSSSVEKDDLVHG